MLQLTVEGPHPGLRLVRVVGPLDQSAASSLLRLVDAQLALVAAGRSPATDLLLDLSGVSSFEPRAIGVMRHIRYSSQLRGVRVRLSGWSARSHLLPIRVNQILREFTSFPTTEVAIATLAAGDIEPAPESDMAAGGAVLPFPITIHDSTSEQPDTVVAGSATPPELRGPEPPVAPTDIPVTDVR